MQLKWYIFIISFCAFLGSLIISLLSHTAFFSVLIKTALLIIAVIMVDGLTATICRLLPKKCANFESKIYRVEKREKQFYEKIYIKKWKEKVPEIGHFTGFRKNKILEPKNPKYIKRFLYEICYGELGHFVSVFSGFIILLCSFISPIFIAVGLLVSIVNAVLNVFPIMVLRYNSYKLYTLYKFYKDKN